jgi:multicomponent Na+:H+ antiporter subunit E
MRAISMGAVLFAFWLALSGHMSAMLLAIGLASALLCVYAARRLRILDIEGHPIELATGFLLYAPWLIVEIGKSALAVARVILDPRLPISPEMKVVKAGQRTGMGIATFANSITLTPGTITVAVNGGELTVHALVGASAADLEGGEMDRRVRALEERAA